jgi:tripartite ATP-independent transporter DctM subunit
MEWFEALALLLGTIIVLMAIGMPVALAFLAANILGAWVFMGGERGIIQLLNNGLGSLTKYALVPIPLFLLMGEVFFHTGLGGRMFNAIDKLLGRLPGRLSYVTVLGGTAFSTLSGSSMGSTALLGSLMVPEMAKRGYKPHMSIGPILGTGGLAIIIPPSALAVLLATLAQIDVAALLIAGVIPGLILAFFYIATIFIQTKIDPTAAPAYDVDPMTFGQKLKLLMTEVVPMVGVMVVIIVLMIRGFVTPSEAAAFGALGVHLGNYEKICNWRSARHTDGLSDRLWFCHVQPATSFFRGVTRIGKLGHLLRSGSTRYAFGDVRRSFTPWNVHGANFNDVANRTNLFPTCGNTKF